MEQTVLLQMKDITKNFPGVRALDKVSLEVKAGTVHALMGENGAGKSTLMKCLFGIYNKDSGHIYLEGREINFSSSKEALNNGVAMVHQELNQALKRSVMDNLWLGRYPKTAGFVVNEKKMYHDTVEIFNELGIDVDPHRIMSTMPVSQRQMVEIAKAVSYHSKIIVFDEPTSSLTEEEVEHLFRIINMLRDRGLGIIYISHKMAEIKRISDEITIMRDGQHIATKPAAELEIALKPEETVRQLYLYKLIHEYGYPASQIEVEFPFHFGREVKRADIAIMDKDRPLLPYIIVELKKPRLRDGKEQLKSYCNATGAPIGVWTNGEQISYYNRKDPNYFEPITNIPSASEKLTDIINEKFTYDDLKQIDRISCQKQSLRALIQEMEDEVLASAGVDSFEEIFKLIFAKLYDELICERDPSAYLKFRNSGETDYELKEKIQGLFDP